ncbi:hypothetical protein [Bartonella sp. B39]
MKRSLLQQMRMAWQWFLQVCGIFAINGFGWVSLSNQPGGSMRDEEVIAAADAHGLAMVFTGVRHFCH